jgi:hypothetical protein
MRRNVAFFLLVQVENNGTGWCSTDQKTRHGPLQFSANTHTPGTKTQNENNNRRHCEKRTMAPSSPTSVDVFILEFGRPVKRLVEQVQGDDRIPDGSQKRANKMDVQRCFSGRKELHLSVSYSRPDRISSAGGHCVADDPLC